MLSQFTDWAADLARTEARPPHWLSFPTVPPDRPDARLIPEADYFRVRVHRIHLTFEREWFATYAPLLLVATQFSYDGDEIVQPALIGPAAIEKLGRPGPTNAVIAGTVVTGPHPLREPNLTVTVALHRVQRSDHAKALLDVVEGAAKALDLLAGLTPYTAVARVVLNGVTAISGGDRPIMARQDEFTPVTAAYHALIAPVPGLDTRSLVVMDDELVELRRGEYVPFRAADHVLYSVDRVSASDVDVTRLPFHRQWLDVLGEANQASTQLVWDSVKTNLSALVRTAFTSPDLTYPHAEQLEQEWTAKVVDRRDSARRLGAMGAGPPAPDDQLRRRALAVLEL